MGLQGLCKAGTAVLVLQAAKPAKTCQENLAIRVHITPSAHIDDHMSRTRRDAVADPPEARERRDTGTRPCPVPRRVLPSARPLLNDVQRAQRVR